MKIIDLLNKIANGEEVPKEIRYNNEIYNTETSDDFSLMIYEAIGKMSDDREMQLFLNDEVKIIEEDKKIKKLEHWVDVKTWVKGNDLEKGLEEQSDFNKNVFYKINEIIDYINKKGNNINNQERER